MGILDDAIKEHLELKRQHGAAEAELKQLEDEAFGAAERPGEEPDPLAEAPTQFMAQPEAESEPAARRSPDIADLQEPPPPPEPEPEPEEPAEEPAPAMEHEAIPSGPTTEEREAIAEQPTEMFDVEEELVAGEAEAPSEEELVEEEISEPRLAPVDPLSGVDAVEEIEVVETIDVAEEADEDDLDDDFWDEKRLSDELDEALEPTEEADAEVDEVEPEPAEEGDEPPAGREEDVLEETPDFLEEAPEDDQLWFEQKPPKDFDFDD